MRIIIDGNDGVGKTTLAKQLQKDLDIKSYIHLTGKDPKDLQFYQQVLYKEDVVFDRSFLSEPVYSKVFGRETSLNPEHFDNLIKVLDNLDNTVVIICYTDENIYSANEYPEVIANKELIDQYFYDIANNHNFIYYNTKEHEYSQLVDYIKQVVGIV